MSYFHKTDLLADGVYKFGCPGVCLSAFLLQKVWKLWYGYFWSKIVFIKNCNAQSIFLKQRRAGGFKNGSSFWGIFSLCLCHPLVLNFYHDNNNDGDDDKGDKFGFRTPSVNQRNTLRLGHRRVQIQNKKWVRKLHWWYA